MPSDTTKPTETAIDDLLRFLPQEEQKHVTDYATGLVPIEKRESRSVIIAVTKELTEIQRQMVIEHAKQLVPKRMLPKSGGETIENLLPLLTPWGQREVMRYAFERLAHNAFVREEKKKAMKIHYDSPYGGRGIMIQGGLFNKK